MAETKSKLPWAQWWQVVSRHYRLFVVGAAVFAIAALIVLPLYMPLKYTGKTVFELRADEAAEAPRGGASGSFEAIRMAAGHDLVGRTAVEEAVEELGFTEGMPRGADGQLTLKGKMEHQQLVRRLMKDLVLTWDTGAKRVNYGSLLFTSKDQELAAKLPNTLVQDYIKKISDRIITNLTQSRQFLQGQASKAEQSLAAVIAERTKFEADNGGHQPEQPGALGEKLDVIDRDIDTSRSQREKAEKELTQLKKIQEEIDLAKAKATPEEGKPLQVVMGPNPALERLQKELGELEDTFQENQALRHMKDEHPTMKMLRGKIELVKAKIEKEPEEVVTQRVFGLSAEQLSARDRQIGIAIAAAESEVGQATKELERLMNRQKDLQDKIATFAPVAQKYEELNRKISDLDKDKKTWQDRLTEVQMALSAEAAQRRTHLSTVTSAEKELRPSDPSLAKVLGIALAGGLAFGAALVFLAESLSQKIVSRTEAATQFDLPVCGVIHEITTPIQRLKRKLGRWVAEPAAVIFLTAVIAIAALNVWLWLERPEDHNQWRADPVGFVSRGVDRVLGRASRALDSL